jgi:hypothetical protein
MIRVALTTSTVDLRLATDDLDVADHAHSGLRLRPMIWMALATASVGRARDRRSWMSLTTASVESARDRRSGSRFTTRQVVVHWPPITSWR